jgi:hypothetical protein
MTVGVILQADSRTRFRSNQNTAVQSKVRWATPASSHISNRIFLLLLLLLLHFYNLLKIHKESN